MGMGLPKLELSFKAAAETAAARFKRGIVAVMVREAKNPGVTVLTSAKQIPTALGAENKAYVERAFVGSDRGVPAKVVLVVIGTQAGEGAPLEDGLALLAHYSLDYLAAPPDVTEAECAAIKSWVVKQREGYGTVKAVLPNTAADSMGMVNFTTGAIQAGGELYEAADYCSRIAGILAGIPTEGSATYAALPEVTDVEALGTEEQEKAIDRGELILIHDGRQAKVARAVNSLSKLPAEGKADWRKIKIVEGMDLITYFARSTIEDNYCGRLNNTYQNKLNLVVAMRQFLQTLEGRGVLQEGSSFCDIDVTAQRAYLEQELGLDTSDLEDQEVREHDTGSWVFLSYGGRLVDAMEDFRASFTNL